MEKKTYKLIIGGSDSFNMNLNQEIALGAYIEGNIVMVQTSFGLKFSILTYTRK